MLHAQGRMLLGYTPDIALFDAGTATTWKLRLVEETYIVLESAMTAALTKALVRNEAHKSHTFPGTIAKILRQIDMN